MQTPFFRANVGICVMNAHGLVLAVERGDKPGAWQLPQGGLDLGETPEQAAFRELEEETGLKSREVLLVGMHPDWLVYELPPEWRRDKVGMGQAQKWFAFQLTPEAEANYKPGALPDGGENRATAWKSLEELTLQVIAFRRPIYQKLLNWVHTLNLPISPVQ